MTNTPKIRFEGFTDDWEQRKVGDHCDMFNGDRSSKYPNAQDMVSDGIPFINAGDLEDGHVNLVTCNKITREKYDDLGGAKLQLGDIVYCLRGTLGKNAYIDNFTEGTVASSLVALRPKNIDGRYLFHILNSDIEYKQRIVHDEGAAQPNLSAKSVSEFIMPVPDIEEQKKVSEFLDELNNLITLHQRKCDETKELKKYMLQKMFPKNGEKKPEIRFSGFAGDWEQRKLSDIAGVYDGVHQTPDYQDEGIMFLSVENIATLTSEKYISEEAYERDYKVRPEKGDILMTRIGDVGTPNVVETDEKLAYYVSLALLKPKGIDSHFLNNAIQSSAFQHGLRERTLLTAIPMKINKDEIGKVDISFPTDVNEQRKIGESFKQLDNLITLHQRKCDEIKEFKKYMLQNMFPQK